MFTCSGWQAVLGTSYVYGASREVVGRLPGRLCLIPVQVLSRMSRSLWRLTLPGNDGGAAASTKDVEGELVRRWQDRVSKRADTLRYSLPLFSRDLEQLQSRR